jgi:hypothetical protein
VRVFRGRRILCRQRDHTDALATANSAHRAMPAPCSLRLRCAVFPLGGPGSSLGPTSGPLLHRGLSTNKDGPLFDKDGPAGIGVAQLTSSRLMQRSHRYQGCVKDGRGDIKDPSRPMPSIRSLATLGGTAAYRRPQRAPRFAAGRGRDTDDERRCLYLGAARRVAGRWSACADQPQTAVTGDNVARSKMNTK